MKPKDTAGAGCCCCWMLLLLSLSLSCCLRLELLTTIGRQAERELQLCEVWYSSLFLRLFFPFSRAIILFSLSLLSVGDSGEEEERREEKREWDREPLPRFRL